MPELCRLGSIKILMFTNDHGEAHFHAVDGRRHDKFFIERLLFELGGRLQPRQEREVRTWARAHQAELRRAWAQASNNQQPDPIK